MDSNGQHGKHDQREEHGQCDERGPHVECSGHVACGDMLSMIILHAALGARVMHTCRPEARPCVASIVNMAARQHRQHGQRGVGCVRGVRA